MCIGIKCLCKSCANNVDNYYAKAKECVNPCFHCEDTCYEYDHDLHKYTKAMEKCENYRITEHHVLCNRRKIKIVK